MTALAGTNVSPSIVHDPIERVSIAKQGTKVQKDAVERKLQEWEALKNTKLYHILTDLADPMIFHLTAEVMRPIMEYPESMSVDRIMEHKAECRGEVRAWTTIKFGPGILREQLDQLEALEKKEEERRAGPSEEEKKRLSNYA